MSKNTNSHLLDFFEHELLNPGSRIIKSNDDFINIAKDRLQLLSKLDPKLAIHYERRVEQITKKISFLDNIKLNNTNDSFEIAQPKDCELRQFALQRIETNGKNTEFFFDNSIWNKLDNVSKAGLVLHEIIYEHLVMLDEKNSIKVRKLNSYLFSVNFEKVKQDEFKKFVKDLNVPLY